MNIEDILPPAHTKNLVLEYKDVIKEGKDSEGDTLEIGWLKLLCSFANTKGGTLIVGVDEESHEILAMDKKTVDKTVLMVRRQIEARIEPEIECRFLYIVVKNGDTPGYILCITIKKSESRPVLLHDSGLLGIFIRKDKKTKLATLDQIKELVIDSENNEDHLAYIGENGKRDLKILSFCTRRGRSAREISECVGVTPSTYFRKVILKRLVNDGLLIEQKDGKTSYYKKA